MAHTHSISQPIRYRYRPNAPAKATPSVSSDSVSSVPCQRSPLSGLPASRYLNSSSPESPTTHSFMQAVSEDDIFHNGAFYGPIDETILAFPFDMQSMKHPVPMAQPLPWTPSSSSVTSDTSSSWASPISHTNISTESQYRIPYLQNPSWPQMTQNSYSSGNYLSMPEAFPILATDSESVTTSLYCPQLSEEWSDQFMIDGLLSACETTEYCSSRGSPESPTEKTMQPSVSSTKPRSSSMMTDASTVSSCSSSSAETPSASPPLRTKSRYEGQLLDFTTPVAQTTWKVPKSTALPCPLATYGCTSSFISKNEWKRHINTQHLRLEAWLCDQCPKRDNKREFNRKDLFIQHLKRMHPSPCPAHSSKVQQAKPKPNRPATKNEKTVKSSKSDDLDPALLLAEQRCHIVLRQPPMNSGCLFCPTVFSGRGSWETRIEHIAKHMEQYKKEGSEVPDPKTWRVDHVLEQWLISENVVTKVRQRWSVA